MAFGLVGGTCSSRLSRNLPIYSLYIVQISPARPDQTDSVCPQARGHERRKGGRIGDQSTLDKKGRRTEAHEVLAPLFSWFSEGFETADLRNAKIMLTSLV
jgi:hypothetical protein